MTTAGTMTCSLLLLNSTAIGWELAVTNNSQLTRSPAVAPGEQRNEETALPSASGIAVPPKLFLRVPVRVNERVAELPFREAVIVAV
jgi:hypothetical protein